MSEKVYAGALLFTNGNAMYFDNDGQQIPELQADQWRGLPEFMERFPGASVAITRYDAMERVFVPGNHMELLMNGIWGTKEEIDE
ncbi:MAG: hypothetical protein HQ559_01795 [Lentisphaerae bacterium]|nr:hypothetical protein [Lentisphaerota bacterium]